MGEDHFWNGVNLALGFEPKSAKEMVGRSGMTHAFPSLGMDEKGRRILVVASALDPKMAALIHSDCEAALGDFKLLTIRPETFSLARFAQLATQVTGSHKIDLEVALKSAESWFKANPIKPETISSIKDLVPALRRNGWAGFEALVPFLNASLSSKIGSFEQVTSLITQLASIDWRNFRQGSANDLGTFDLNFLAAQDGSLMDQKFGLCAMPLFELDDGEWEDLSSGSKIEKSREGLKKLGVVQYFEPPTDHAALALVDRGISDRMKVSGAILKLPEIGHNLAEDEFLQSPSNLLEKLDQLNDSGYIAEAEFGFVVTEKGKEIRSTVKLRPREGVFSKLLNRIGLNFTVNPHDFLK